jgi:hypothetical protein
MYKCGEKRTSSLFHRASIQRSVPLVSCKSRSLIANGKPTATVLWFELVVKLLCVWFAVFWRVEELRSTTTTTKAVSHVARMPRFVKILPVLRRLLQPSPFHVQSDPVSKQ